MRYVFLAVTGFALAASAVHADEFTFDHDNVLGTFLHLRVDAPTLADAQAIEESVLAQIDRFERVFSTYDAHSELSQFLASPVGTSRRVTSDLATLMQVSDHWQRVTRAAYHPGAEAIVDVWRAASKQDRLPLAGELQQAVERLKTPAWALDPSTQTARRESHDRFSFNALAEGYILDRVVQHVRDKFAPQALLINLGGEVYGFGRPFLVGVRNPLEPDATGAPLASILLQDRAMSTSGGYRRGFTIAGRLYSHVIDPRSGQPVEHLASTTVVARTATEADALATALHVMPVAEALELADSLADVSCLIVDREGRMWSNQLWQAMFGAQTVQKAAQQVAFADEGAAWNGGKELAVGFEINQPANSGRYRRPYVAVWVEDKDGFPVRTLSLWVQSSGPGPRWIPDLRRWYKSDTLRRVADSTDLVRTMSEATRKPGKHQLVWNGKDDQGQFVEPGDYTLYVESAREHGTYQLIKQPLKIGTAAFKHQPAGNVEIKDVVIEYRDRKLTKP